MSASTQKIRREDVIGLPEGARIQFNPKSKSQTITVFFPFYFRDEKGKPACERDYIGTVVDGKFAPNAYYLLNCPVKGVRPPERWKNAVQREKAMKAAEQKSIEQTSSDWHQLEIQSDEDITKQVGASALCARILYDEKLVEDVARTLNYDVSDTMHALNLAMHMALTSKASYLAKAESETCKFIGSGCLSSQRISEFLVRIGSSLQLSTRIGKFRTQRMTKDGDLLAVDGTFIDSNSRKISAAAQGKRKDGTYGPQINFALVSNASTGVPLGYRWYSGDTHDVTTLDDFRELWLDYGLNRKKVEFVWDRGYYDAGRLARYTNDGLKVISGAKVGLNVIKQVIENRNSEFYSASALLEHHYCFGLAENIALDRKTTAKAYVFFSPNKQMVEARELRDELRSASDKWLAGKLKQSDDLMRFFKKPVKGMPLSVDEDAFDQECYVKGFFACISNTNQSLDSVLDKYRTRNEIEVLFRLMIGKLISSTRVQSSAALEGLLFIVFIALSILGRLRKALKTQVPSRKNTRAANCDVIDYDQTYTLDDYVTISEALAEVRGVTATVSKRTGKVRLANLTEAKRNLVRDMGFGDLFQSADAVWDLLSAKHLSEVIRTVKEQDEAVK